MNVFPVNYIDISSYLYSTAFETDGHYMLDTSYPACPFVDFSQPNSPKEMQIIHNYFFLMCGLPFNDMTGFYRQHFV